MMLKKTDPVASGLLSPIQQLILMHLRRNSAPIGYYGIGRPIPGVSRKIKGWRWEQTGAELKEHHRTVRTVKDKVVTRTRVAFPLLLKTGRYVSTKRTKQQRMRDRLAKGIPANA